MDTMYTKIKELCEEKGIKLSALAAEIGVRSSVFTELKMGRTKQLSLATLFKIADFFGVTVDSLMADGAMSDVEIVEDELFRKRKLLFDMSAKASAEDLDKILKIVDTLLEKQM